MSDMVDDPNETIVVSIDQVTNADLAMPPPDPVPITIVEDTVDAQIGGFVFLDSNGNGIRDAGEVGLAGVQVTLTRTDGPGGAPALEVLTWPWNPVKSTRILFR